MNVMSKEEIIDRVKHICQAHNVSHLRLFGSYAKETNLPTSDIDFVVFGCDEIEELRSDIDDIPTLRQIDVFDYDSVTNPYLREDMDKYGIQIF